MQMLYSSPSPNSKKSQSYYQQEKQNQKCVPRQDHRARAKSSSSSLNVSLTGTAITESYTHLVVTEQPLRVLMFEAEDSSDLHSEYLAPITVFFLLFLHYLRVVKQENPPCHPWLRQAESIAEHATGKKTQVQTEEKTCLLSTLSYLSTAGS